MNHSQFVRLNNFLDRLLEAILVAELVDNDCWETLIDLARSLGHDAVADQFADALQHEREHLENVRIWLAAALNLSATGDAMSGRARRRAQTKTATRELHGSSPKKTRKTKGGASHRRKRK